MQDETVRTAFTFAPLLRHRTSDAARRITAVSFDTAAGRVFIGLASGHVEEHEIVMKQAYALDAAPPGAGAHATTRLVAEKRVSKQPIQALICLPTTARLAILCDDGTAFVAAYDTWNVVALQGVRTALAMAADPAPAAAAAAARRPTDLSSSSGTGRDISNFITSGAKARAPVAPAASVPPPRPVRLAIAVKGITTAAKLLVYSIAPSLGVAASQQPAHLLAQISLQDAVQNLIWAGSGLFVQHATSYSLVQPGGRLVQIAEHGCLQPRMASAPWHGGPAATEGDRGGGAATAAVGALLFQDSLILLTDDNGAAVVGSEPIPVSESPLALCSSGAFLVVVSDSEGVLVYDRSCSRLVQRIFWAHDDPWVAAARRIAVAEDAGGGGGVAVATSGIVMLLQPVAPDVQVRELLKRKRFDAALALIRSCRRATEDWADTALAQAGLLMLQELRCEDALAALEEVGLSTFQPAQLLPLFPRTCRRWLPTLPHHSYWGLHGSLQSLDRICDDFLELRNSTTSSPRPSPSPPASLRSSAAVGAVLPPPQTAAAAVAARLLLRQGTPPEPSLHGSQGLHQGQLHQPQRHHHHHRSHHYHHHNHSHQYSQQQPQQQLHEAASPVETAVAAPAYFREGPLSPAASAAGWAFAAGGEVAALAADAKRHIVSYLLRNRVRPGVVCLEGIDTLLVHLLIDAGATAVLEALLEARGGSGVDGCGVGGGVDGEAGDGDGGSGGGRGGTGATAVPPPPPANTGGGGGGGRGGGLVALAAAGQLACVSPRDPAVVTALEMAGRWHALAILRAARGQVPQALELWQRLALGEMAEAPSASGAVAAAAAAVASTAPLGDDVLAVCLPSGSASSSAATSSGGGGGGGGGSAAAPAHETGGVWAAAAATVAAAAAATLMAVPARTPPLLCLSKLPWLLQVAPDWALHVLRSRPLPVADVMSLLQGRYDGVRWQYLHHLVYGGGSVATAAAQSGAGDGGAASEGALVDSGAGVEAAAAMPAAVAWHMDPALHTELALEVVECIALLHSRSQQSRRHEEQPLRLHHGQSATQEQDRSAAALPPSAFASLSTVQVNTMIVEELPPSLPPLPPPPSPPPAAATAAVARHPSTSDDATAVATTAARACSPPPLPIGAVTHRLRAVSYGQPQLSRAQATTTQAHPHPHSQQPQYQQQHQERSQGRARVNWHVQHRSLASPAPSRMVPAGADGGDGGAALVAYGAAASAAAATAALSVSTAELAWLGTLGILPAVAVARQLAVALRAAQLAASLDSDPALQLDLDAAAGAPAAAAVSDDGVAFSSAAAGCLGDSLSLLRALSRRGDGDGVGTLSGLRTILQHHLYSSKLYDASIVLQAVANGSAATATSNGGDGLSALLLRERVQLHCRQGDHSAALAVLALQLGDVDGAICYCRTRCGQEGWLALLDLLLRPRDGRGPDYGAACRVLAAEGAALAPLQVLEALNDDMPIHLAHGTLSRMVGSVLHRKRQGQVLRALHRAQNLALRAELAQLQASRVLVTEETMCRGCQRPLATQVFYRYPSGVVLCARCVRPDPESTRGDETGWDELGKGRRQPASSRCEGCLITSAWTAPGALRG